MRSSVVEQIKERVDIVALVGEYVKLTKAGKNFRGLSPFNKEKTPSFFVSPERGMYYCFSSNKGGDIFTFIQEMEGVDFRGALKILAERAGIALVPERKEARDARERLYQIMEDAASWYTAQLSASPEAQAYLAARGVREETRRTWRLGFAPAAWRALLEALKQKGYREDELEKAGLVKKSERGTYYDRFRSRILFPLCDSAGRVVAFSGRAVGQEGGAEVAKYLNSPETPLYDKSSLLYGYDRAKGAIRRFNFALVVEGQMDLVMSHQAGFPNTVAVSGTAFTPQHLSLLRRLTANLVVAFDADAAGMRSLGRVARMALAEGMEVKTVVLPEGSDPADCVRESPEAWRTAVKSSIPVVEHYLALLRAATRDERAYVRAVRAEVFPLVAAMPHAVDRALWAGHIARALSVPEDTVREEIAVAAQETPRAAAPPRTAPGATTDIAAPAEGRYQHLQRMAVAVRWYTEDIAEKASADAADASLAALHQRAEALVTDEEMAPLTPARTRLLFELEDKYLKEEGHHARIAALHAVLDEWERAKAQRRLKELHACHAAAEAAGREEEAEALLREIQEISLRLHEGDTA